MGDPHVKFDWTVEGAIGSVADESREVLAEGYDGLWVGETSRDPFVAATLAVAATASAAGSDTGTGAAGPDLVGTAIAVAFARNPMTVAYQAHDLQEISGGRFVLGLGTQVQAHIERRFSMPWSNPVGRMGEFVGALRAIWASWQDGSKLAYRGRYYTHTLMAPFFAAPALAAGPPPVYLAGVGEQMTELAGEVADGFLFHAFTTPDYLRKVTLPALRRGREAAGLTMDGYVVCGPAMAVVTTDEATRVAGVAEARSRIAFYASTPAYRPVLELHGWGDLQSELAGLVRDNRWPEMGSLIDDEVLDAFVVVGDATQVAAGLAARYGGVADRLTCYSPAPLPPAAWRPLLDAARSI